MLALNPSSLTIFAKGYKAEELANQLIEFGGLSERLGVDLLSARPLMNKVARELTDCLSIEKRRLLAAFHHELDHANVHLSTSFGAISNLLDQIFVDCLALQMAERSNDLPSWLSDPDRRKAAARADTRESCDATTYDLLALRSLSALLAGRAGAANDQKVTRALQLLLAYLQPDRATGHLRVRLHPGDEYQHFFRPEDPFQPYLETRPIGASALIEGQAVFVQEYELEMLGLQLDELTTFYEAPVSIYHLTQAIWLQFFSGHGSDAVRTWEYLWALELALWMPLFPTSGPLVPELAWHDIHPGWRFLKVCNYLRSSNYQFLDDSADADDAADFEPSFINDVCARFGWPTPREIAGRWIDREADRTVLRFYGERNTDGIPVHPRVRLMRNYFHWRCHDRGCDLHGLNLRHFPVAAVICDDSSFMLPTGCWGMYDDVTGNRLFRLKEYAIYDFAKYLALGEGLGAYLLRNEMAEFAAQSLSDAVRACARLDSERHADINRALKCEIERIRRPY